MSVSENKSKIGQIGEKICRNFLTEQGHKVIDSVDLFDRQKDFLCDGKKVEVKTMQPYVTKNCFGIGISQLRKCKSIDELYIVTVTPKPFPRYEHSKRIFKVLPTFEYFEYSTRYGERMFGIPIDQESVECVYTLSDKEAKYLDTLAESNY